MFEHIIVVGNGKTSRANIEALIDDYIYANPKVKFSLYSTLGVLSEGQGWLKAYLADKEIAHESVRELETVSGQKTAVFILWSDEDADSLWGLATAKELGVQAFDLTDGLALITPTADLKFTTEPKIPIEEQLSEKDSEDLERELKEVPEIKEEIEAEEDPEEGEYEDPLYEAINIIAGMFAEAIAKELQKILTK